MEKINFEDATLKKSAYVTIGGTEYPVTDAEYVGGVDLDAATLNYAFQLMHPVGSVYISTSSANPADVFGFGTWEPCCVGRFPLGVDEMNPNIGLSGLQDGEKEVTLTIDEMPLHEHEEYYVTNDGNRNPAVIGSAGSVNGTYAKLEDSFEQNRTPLMTGKSGGSQPHNNMPPYETFYFWKRTA